jgi:hypothetical protein
MSERQYWLGQAERCTRLARQCATEDIARELNRMAEDFRARARNTSQAAEFPQMQNARTG